MTLNRHGMFGTCTQHRLARHLTRDMYSTGILYEPCIHADTLPNGIWQRVYKVCLWLQYDRLPVLCRGHTCRYDVENEIMGKRVDSIHSDLAARALNYKYRNVHPVPQWSGVAIKVTHFGHNVLD